MAKQGKGATESLNWQRPLAQFILDSGLSVEMDTLHQEATYGGVEMGAPGTDLNGLLLRNVPTTSQDIFSIPVPSLLYVQTFANPDGNQQLPAVLCLAHLSAFEHAPMRATRHVVAWYQDTMAPPIDAQAIEKIRELDWNAVCTDACWWED